MTEKKFTASCGVITYWTNSLHKDRRTLVLLPGLTADHRLFAPQLRHFKDKVNLLVWDAPGHGASRPFRLDFSLDDKAEWLHGILKAEGITDPVLIGQSMGGYVAQAYMDLFPGTVSGFISIDSAPLQRRYITAAELWLLKRMEPFYRIYPRKRLLKDGPRGTSETEAGRRYMYDTITQFTREEYCRLAGHGFRILAEAIEKKRPYCIDCPCLLICGDHDKAGSAKRYNKNWAKHAHLPIFWAEGAGHNSNMDCPEVINRRIELFLRLNA